MTLYDRDSWVLFMNFDRTKNQEFSAANVAHTIFEETERQFLERHVMSKGFMTPQLHSQASQVEGGVQGVPPVISDLEIQKYDQKRTHWQLFKSIDTDGDGRVSRDDLVRFVSDSSQGTMTPQKTHEVIAHFGLTNKDSITFAEFYSRLYHNIGNTHLMEKENQTNILQSKQFDHQRYKDGYAAVKSSLEGFKDRFRLHGDDNRSLTRLLHPQPVQVYPRVPKHVREPPAAADQRPVPGLPDRPQGRLPEQGRVREGRPGEAVG